MAYFAGGRTRIALFCAVHTETHSRPDRALLNLHFVSKTLTQYTPSNTLNNSSHIHTSTDEPQRHTCTPRIYTKLGYSKTQTCTNRVMNPPPETHALIPIPKCIAVCTSMPHRNVRVNLCLTEQRPARANRGEDKHIYGQMVVPTNT